MMVFFKFSGQILKKRSMHSLSFVPNQSHKHLGLRMAMNSYFSAEKEHVRTEMKQWLEALAEDRVLSRREKELVIETAVCSVFCYSAGLIDWTRAG